MIERHWKGIAKTEEADHYIQHLLTETFPQLSTITGFIRSSVLRRTVERGIEFRVVTVWSSVEAIKQFAGEIADLAVVPPHVKKMMVEYDAFAFHYEIVATHGTER